MVDTNKEIIDRKIHDWLKSLPKAKLEELEALIEEEKTVREDNKCGCEPWDGRECFLAQAEYHLADYTEESGVTVHIFMPDRGIGL